MPNEFKPNKPANGKFDPLLRQNKRVNIKGEFDFSGKRSDESTSTFKDFNPVQTDNSTHIIKRGRPISITDSRNKVSVPKKISPALNSKVSVLKDYMTEFQSETGRITFEMILDNLVESYITKNLGMAKEEHIRDEIEQKFDELKK